MVNIVFASRTKKRSFVSIDEMVERLGVVLSDDQRRILERAARRDDIVYADYAAEMIGGTRRLHLGTSYEQVQELVAQSTDNV